jgi:hypothetical protein
MANLKVSHKNFVNYFFLATAVAVSSSRPWNLHRLRYLGQDIAFIVMNLSDSALYSNASSVPLARQVELF